MTRAEPTPAPEAVGDGMPDSRLDERWAAASPAARRAVRIAAPTLVLGVAAATRLIGLDEPATLVFDETYYVKDALSLLQLGYEGRWPDGANEGFAAGAPGSPGSEAAFVAHPPLGKWIIALGLLAVGPETPVGWRIATALAGVAVVGLVMLIAFRLWRSVGLASLAGGLVAIDGNAIVMSRVALLDGLLTLFVLIAVLFVILDRRASHHRLREWLARRRFEGRPTDWGPVLWGRSCLIAAGVAFGLAVSIKWSALYLLAAFAVLTVAADALDRRSAGVSLWASGTLLRQAPASALLVVPVALAAHLVTWTGWFLSNNGYDRQWIASGGERWTGILAWVPDAVQNLWHYQASVYGYHVGESSPHAYEAPALGWPLLLRPTYMHYVDGGDGTAVAISGIPNPLLWWASVAAVIVLVIGCLMTAVAVARGTGARAAIAPFGSPWALAVILTGVAAGWLPWLLYPERTMFFFYTVVLTPFLTLALVAVLRAVLGGPADPAPRRRLALAAVALLVVVAVALSAFFLPMWTGWPVPIDFLRLHYWLPGWI
ncbi:MAG: phospholipid carrier-dependent glycosyltransferase [Microcella sp.]|uniref:dolichyl-phosphate-mannose--protein mannosyltransferase n=1 Tax=Microcella sp. TaxID=1913979 RepID=UPI00271A4C67|nr:phospholipid carrier-dependent glycosyltransferase [Microcella sp.]MDO8338697.1 phospholipid carrier-dependent glycosyltransferase [Microcella sp.]